MTTRKSKESKRAEASLWGLMVAINSEHMPFAMPPLAPLHDSILEREINRSAGVDVPKADVAEEAMEPTEQKDEEKVATP